eukprot:900229-Pleurochrysis_carterae.AAC.1
MSQSSFKQTRLAEGSQAVRPYTSRIGTRAFTTKQKKLGGHLLGLEDFNAVQSCGVPVIAVNRALLRFVVCVALDRSTSVPNAASVNTSKTRVKVSHVASMSGLVEHCLTAVVPLADMKRAGRAQALILIVNVVREESLEIVHVLEKWVNDRTCAHDSRFVKVRCLLSERNYNGWAGIMHCRGDACTWNGCLQHLLKQLGVHAAVLLLPQLVYASEH